MTNEKVAFVYECKRCRKQFCGGSASPEEAATALAEYATGTLLKRVGRMVHECEDRGRGIATVVGHGAPYAETEHEEES